MDQIAGYTNAHTRGRFDLDMRLIFLRSDWGDESKNVRWERNYSHGILVAFYVSPVFPPITQNRRLHNCTYIDVKLSVRACFPPSVHASLLGLWSSMKPWKCLRSSRRRRFLSKDTSWRVARRSLQSIVQCHAVGLSAEHFHISHLLQFHRSWVTPLSNAIVVLWPRIIIVVITMWDIRVLTFISRRGTLLRTMIYSVCEVYYMKIYSRNNVKSIFYYKVERAVWWIILCLAKVLLHRHISMRNNQFYEWRSRHALFFRWISSRRDRSLLAERRKKKRSFLFFFFSRHIHWSALFWGRHFNGLLCVY